MYTWHECTGGVFDRCVVDWDYLDVGQGDIDHPSFEDAVERLRTFLSEQSLPSEIRWLGVEGCALKKRQLYVRLRESDVVESEVRAVYVAAVVSNNSRAHEQSHR